MEATNEHKPCLTTCPDEAPFYYDTSNAPKICLKKCNNYYDGNKCVGTCNEYVYMANQCISECPFDAPFYIEKSNDSPPIKECVVSCPENNYQYYENSSKRCTNELNEKMIFKEGIVDSCPYQLTKNEESSKCQFEGNTYNYFIVESDTATGQVECNSYNPYITSSKQCVKQCPLGENFINGQNKNCLSSCIINSNSLYYKKKKMF